MTGVWGFCLKPDAITSVFVAFALNDGAAKVVSDMMVQLSSVDSRGEGCLGVVAGGLAFVVPRCWVRPGVVGCGEGTAAAVLLLGKDVGI